ncbi:MAG TPA: hypothetical protein VIQ60_13735 [Gemmatimonadaceae bacterium]
MTRRSSRHAGVRMRAAAPPLAAAIAMVLALPNAPVAAQTAAGATPLTLENAEWRHIGPAAFGGRIDAVVALPHDPSVIYVGAASGGIFKSTNRGTTWKPIFDRFGGSLSIGDIAVAPSDPNIVWAGSGEQNNRQSSSWGDGVYRSLDGGETWTNMGLRETHHIGRVVIHPRDPNIVYVAALGHLWGQNEERGLYRTTDGGKSWRKVLGVDAETGVVDVVLDADGRTLIAATYQRRRRAWGFVGGGPGSAMYRSLDGGESWEKLTRGLPEGPTGRIGLALAPSDPNVVYAIIENRNGGVYRSDDRGVTWVRKNPLNPRPMYYSTLRVDPRNPDKVWVLDAYLWLSTDGGKTFTSDSTGEKIHVDHHSLWINPADPDHLMLGNDGGLYFSYDGARNWHFVDNLPIGQYYDISVDDREPYWVYGGTQDNGTWAIPSRTATEAGILNSHVRNMAHGDGFYTQPDPSDSRYLYANSQSGRAYFVDSETLEERGIRPVPSDTAEKYRFNWSTPLLLSPHDGNVAYYGGNRLFRTRDRGTKWEVVSPDLTKNQDWKKLPIMGVIRDSTTLSLDDGVADYGTITSISESPLQRGLIYVGTDDGNVQVTSDDGRNWQDITSRFKLPGARWVSRVLASRHAAGTAYVVFDGHQDDDFAPYLFRSIDGGKSWQSAVGDMPHGNVINALAEHPRNAQVLLAGTEFGLFITYNGGRNWKLAGGNLPRVPVDDIVIHERTNDIVLGTHGRSIIILDDSRFLDGGDPVALRDGIRLYPPPRGIQVHLSRALPTPSTAKFAGPNPEPGIPVTYAVAGKGSESGKAGGSGKESEGGKARASGTAGSSGGVRAVGGVADSAKISIIARDGSVVRELTGPGGPGLHRVVWDLRHALPFEPSPNDFTWFGQPKGQYVLPGKYTVRLAVGGQVAEESVEVTANPLARTTEVALEARWRAAMAVNELLRAWNDASKASAKLVARLERATDTSGAVAASDADRKALEELGARAKKLDGIFASGWGTLKSDILDVSGAMQSSTGSPTEAQLLLIERHKGVMSRHIEELNTVLAEQHALDRRIAAGGGGGAAPSVELPKE